MSLKKYKTRSKLIEEEIDHLELSPFRNCSQWWNSYYFYEESDDYYMYDYSPCDNCGLTYCHDYECCQEHGYIELPEIEWGYKIIKKAFRRYDMIDPSLQGGYIDMETIYNKETIRDRKIDLVLGLRKDIEKPTFGDLFYFS